MAIVQNWCSTAFAGDGSGCIDCENDRRNRNCDLIGFIDLVLPDLETKTGIDSNRIVESRFGAAILLSE